MVANLLPSWSRWYIIFRPPQSYCLLISYFNGACVISDAWILTLYAFIQKHYQFYHTNIGPSLECILSLTNQCMEIGHIKTMCYGGSHFTSLIMYCSSLQYAGWWLAAVITREVLYSCKKKTHVNSITEVAAMTS